MKKIAVIGQGYVGLPLAIEFAHHFPVVGFDINEERVRELAKGIDRTHEADIEKLSAVLKDAPTISEREHVLETSRVNGAAFREFPDSLDNDIQRDCGQDSRGLFFSSEISHIKDAQIFIVTVPTPIDRLNAPDLSPLIKASEMLGRIIKPGDIVIYESTVYPGCTEEECVPVLEKTSGLVFNQDFFVGYSPERINPGDKVNTLTTITKVTSGSTPEIAEEIDQLYKTVVTAGTHKASSIKVAEASKAIENAQRDVNISFVNELALIFDRIGIDTHDVIEAAGTKWNFLKYKPGLVGGHCIGVDPYYLAHKAKALGYHPEVILSGRRVNDNMGAFVADKVVKLMIQKDHKIKGAKALIMGVTFKENCPDVRNTRVVDIYHELLSFGLDVDIFDPWADADEVKAEYGLTCHTELLYHSRSLGTSSEQCHPELVEGLVEGGYKKYDAIIIAVAHNEFITIDFNKIKNTNGVIFDTKACLDRALVDARL